MSAFSLKKTERILKRADFLRLSKSGKKIHREYFLVSYCRNSLGHSRLGVTASKKVGCAVIRNRIKRLVREYFRLNKALIKAPYDLNIIAKAGAASLTSQEISRTLEPLFLRISKDCRDEAVVVGTH